MAFADGIADFRSDTVTRPTPEMLKAMAAAPVGDDVYAEDPTVNALQDEAAALFGKEAALFTPTGSMGNQLAIGLQTTRGDEVLCVERAHVRNYELGAGAAISGVQFRTVRTDGGVITPDDIAHATQESSYHLPPISLMVWENTHNPSGGTIVPIDVMTESSSAARRLGLAIHLDGARIFNAVVAARVSPAVYGSLVDTVQFCFSKGLGAPIGSMLCGPADLISRARTLRKRLGGGMRQVGVLAAAAKVALDRRDDLAADHEVASYLDAAVRTRFGDDAVSGPSETNMVIVDSTVLPLAGAELVAHLAERGVLVGGVTSTLLRFVTHHDVDKSDVDRLVEILDDLAG